MSATTAPATFTADTENVADVIALSYEGLGLSDLPPDLAGRYFDIANDLVGEPRDLHAMAEVIALAVHDAGCLDQVAPCQFAEALDAADDVLRQF